MPINESFLYLWYKPSYKMALMDMVIHQYFLAITLFFLVQATLCDQLVVLYGMLVPFLGLLLHRTFVVFHDCCHHSYFPPIEFDGKRYTNPLNTILAIIYGILTMTSVNWMLDHAIHHKTNGRLHNSYGFKFNELLYYTANQYRRFSWPSQCIFAFFHFPFVFFTFFPLLYFAILQRGLYLFKKAKYGAKIQASWLSIAFHHGINNMGVGVLLFTLHKCHILTPYLLATYIGWLINFILFFNQHTYNPCYVVKDEEWSQKESGILGSSFIQIPWILKYFTMGIEYHHVHHMNTKIPGYHTQEYHEAVTECYGQDQTNHIFHSVVHLSLTQCMRNLSLVLYDEEKGKYVTRQEVDAELSSIRKKQE